MNRKESRGREAGKVHALRELGIAEEAGKAEACDGPTGLQKEIGLQTSNRDCSFADALWAK